MSEACKDHSLARMAEVPFRPMLTTTAVVAEAQSSWTLDPITGEQAVPPSCVEYWHRGIQDSCQDVTIFHLPSRGRISANVRPLTQYLCNNQYITALTLHYIAVLI